MKIPDEVRQKHWMICKTCTVRRMYAKRMDIHFDWIDCPYDCENDIEHWGKGETMRDVTIRDYIGGMKELTAEQVRKLPAGTRIIRHSFDRYGAHQTLEMRVVMSGRSRALAYKDCDYLTKVKKIVKETDRMCYTEVVS